MELGFPLMEILDDHMIVFNGIKSDNTLNSNIFMLDLINKKWLKQNFAHKSGEFPFPRCGASCKYNI